MLSENVPRVLSRKQQKCQSQLQQTTMTLLHYICQKIRMLDSEAPLHLSKRSGIYDFFSGMFFPTHENM